MKITNFTQRENAYKYLEKVENFDPFELYLRDFATKKESEKLEKHLNRIAERINHEIKQFELKRLKS